MVLRSSTTLTAGRSGTSALSIRVISVGAEVGSGVAGVLVREGQAEAVLVDVAGTAVCRLTVLMSQTQRETSRLTSGSDSVLRDHTLHSSDLVLDGAAVPADATVTVILTGSVMRVQLTLPVTVIPLLPLTVIPTRRFPSVDRRMVVVSDAARTTVDSRMVLVANDR